MSKVSQEVMQSVYMIIQKKIYPMVMSIGLNSSNNDDLAWLQFVSTIKQVGRADLVFAVFSTYSSLLLSGVFLL